MEGLLAFLQALYLDFCDSHRVRDLSARVGKWVKGTKIPIAPISCGSKADAVAARRTPAPNAAPWGALGARAEREREQNS
jgi:hypothetical protein